MKRKPYFYEMPNGIKVIAQQVDTASYADILISTGIGNIHFPESQSGLPHLFEHLAFAGTHTRDFREIESLRNSSLGYTGASTGKTDTTYYGGAPAPDGLKGFETIVDILSDMLQNSTVPPERLEHERNIVLNEMGQRFDNPEKRLTEMMEQSVFGTSPYGRRIAGTKELVERFRREDCLSVLERYSSDKIIIAVTGPADAEELASIVINKFSDFSRKPNPPIILPPIMQSRLVDIGSTDFLEQNYFCAVFPVQIGFQSRAFNLIEGLHRVLNERLETSRNENDFTYGIQSGFDFDETQTHFHLAGCTRPETSDRFLSEIAKQIDKLKSGVTEDEIQRQIGKSIIGLSNIHNVEDSLRPKLLNSMRLWGEVFDQEKDLAILRSIRPDDVNQALVISAMTDAVALGYLGREPNFMDFNVFRGLCGQVQKSQPPRNGLILPTHDIA